jgi:hypothetical protein
MKATKTSVSITSFWDKISTQHLPNMKAGVLTTRPQCLVKTILASLASLFVGDKIPLLM